MYLNYFNLKKEPFNITPDPDLLFLSPSHKEALAAAIYGVTQRKGFVAIIGEVGVGKTTIIRSFLERMHGQDLKVIYLFNADLSFQALLKTIYHNLGYAADTTDIFEQVSRLHEILIEMYQRGTNVVLIIDEAQHLPVDTLKSLHMLSNLETATDKLIQVVFSGQPEFEEKLASEVLRQIRQRVVIKVRILPLTRKDSVAYIRHRLLKTAKRNADLFTAGAIETIVHQAHGIPRVINTLCDNCLITCYGRQQKKVSTKVAREIASELKGARVPLLKRRLRHALWGAGLVAVLAAAFFSYRSATGPVAAVSPQVPAHPAPTHRVPTAVRPSGEAPVPATTTPSNLPQVEKVAQRPQPRQEEPVPGAVKTISTESRIVKKGDTLARLIVERYGFVDKKLIQRVKEHNPGIANEDLIQEGSSIRFPPLEAAGGRRQVQ